MGLQVLSEQEKYNRHMRPRNYKAPWCTLLKLVQYANNSFVKDRKTTVLSTCEIYIIALWISST